MLTSGRGQYVKCRNRACDGMCTGGYKVDHDDLAVANLFIIVVNVWENFLDHGYTLSTHSCSR